MTNAFNNWIKKQIADFLHKYLFEKYRCLKKDLEKTWQHCLVIKYTVKQKKTKQNKKAKTHLHVILSIDSVKKENYFKHFKFGQEKVFIQPRVAKEKDFFFLN